MKCIELQQGDCLELIKNVATESVDCILTDPPYLYLKHKLDRPFDEDALFAEFDRVVKPNGFVVIFGRGVSLARWTCKLDALGFKLKEEIVWDKKISSSPVSPIGRIHELIILFAKGGGKVRRTYIPFEEGCVGVEQTQVLRRLREALQSLGSPKYKNEVEKYLQYGIVEFKNERSRGYQHTIGKSKERPSCISWLRMIVDGSLEKTIIRISRKKKDTIHPTQKPVRLLERLLELTTDEGAMVLDPFAGSGSTLVACRRTGRRALGFEIDDEYYHRALEHIATDQLNSHTRETALLHAPTRQAR